MRQIGLLPAGCHQCDQIMVHASDEKLLFASKLALYVLNARTYALERIISCQARAIASLSVNSYDMNLVACSGYDGTVCVWDISTEEVVVKSAHPCNAVAWDPHNKNMCALLSNNPKMTLHIWNAKAAANTIQRLYVHDSDNVSASVLRWNPHILGQLAFGCSNGVVYIFDNDSKKIAPLKVSQRTLSVVDIQWDRLSAIYMIVAYQTFISLWDTESGSEVHLFEKQSTGISCLAWMDWTAGNFVSSNPKTGVIKLWNASQKQPLESIRVHSGGINAISFASGGSARMLCACSDGAVVLYNMKNRLVEFKTQGGHTDTIFDCAYRPNSPDILATCSYDGTVKVWNTTDLSLTQTLYGTECIIYSCSWSPDSRKVVASNIAGEVLVWDAETARIMVKYQYHSKSSYSVAWNQHDPSLIMSTSADNTAVVIEISMDDIEDLSSHKNQRIGSRRNFRTAKKHVDEYGTPRCKTVYKHGNPVFGCAWALVASSTKYFATGCQDSVVRIFEYPSTDRSCLYAFSGHNARSFSVAWSPLVPGLLASGSDDKKVLVWEVAIPKKSESPKKVNFLRQLVGHKSNIRALSWNHEQRQILISGSWDATIRIWNVVSASCLQVIYDHVADVYTITSHQARPFCYVSCSRDSTLRVWEIEGLILRLRYKALLSGTLDSIIGETRDDEPPPLTWTGDSLEPVLYGRYSRQLNRAFSAHSPSHMVPPSLPHGQTDISDPVDKLALAEMYRNFYNFFSGSNGSGNLWDCVVAVCKHRVDPSKKHLVKQHVDHNSLTGCGISEAFPEHAIIGIAKSTARQLEQVKMTARRGDISGKAEEQLRQAAMLFAQCGDFLKYCSIMIEIGDWMAALAMAPCVSHDYWMHLMKGHANYLKNKSSEDCIPFLIGTGQDREAVDFYLKRKDSLSAMIVSKMSEGRTDIIPDLSIPTQDSKENKSLDVMAYASWSGDVEKVCRERTETEEDESRRMIRQVALQLVEANISLAKPICAAAHLVAVNDLDAAVQLLMICGEYDMSLAMAKCFGMDTTHILIAMAEKAEYLKDIDLALSIYQQLPPPTSERESALLIARKTVIRSQSLSKLPTLENIDIEAKIDNEVGDDDALQRAQEAEAIGHDDEAVLFYILGGNHAKAVEVGLSRLDKFVFTPFQLSPIAKNILKTFRNVRAVDLNSTLKLKFLCTMCWFGAYAAIQFGFWTTSWSMLKVLGKNVTAEFPIPRSIIAIQELCVRVQCKDEDALSLIENILVELKHDRIIPEKVSCINRHLQSIQSLLQDVIREQSASDLLGGRIQSMSPASLHSAPLYGVITDHVEKEIRDLQSVLGLPTLPSTLRCPPAGVPSVLTSEFGVGGNGCVKGLPTVMQGSLLPVANQGMKVLTSCVTERKVLGTVVALEDEASFLPLNEAIMWKKVNPFSPLFSGNVVNIF